MFLVGAELPANYPMGEPVTRLKGHPRPGLILLFAVSTEHFQREGQTGDGRTKLLAGAVRPLAGVPGGRSGNVRVDGGVAAGGSGRVVSGPVLNVRNRTLFHGDNLPVLKGINSGTVDLVATDPPFQKGRDFHATPGSLAAGASFQDRWRWEAEHDRWQTEAEAAGWENIADLITTARVCHSDDMGAFLAFMTVRLIECRRILKPTGSLFLHCDPTASHYLKALLDSLFGVEQFRNEIVWAYTGPGSPKMRQFNRKHDIIFWYSKTGSWTFNRDAVRVPYKKLNTGGWGMTKEVRDEQMSSGKVPETWWPDIALAVRSF